MIFTSSAPLRVSHPVRVRARTKLLQMGAQVDQQVSALLLATAAVGGTADRDDLRQPTIDPVIDAAPGLEHCVARYAERLGNRAVRLVEQRPLENAPLAGREADAWRRRREQLRQSA